MEHSQAGVPSIPSETLLQCSSDLLTVHDRDGTVLYANAACERLLGVPPELAVGTTLFRLVHPEDRAVLSEALVELRDQPGGVHVFRVRALHRDGTYRHLESLARNGLDDPTLPCVLLSTRDVTDRAGTELALRGSEARHRQLVEQAPIGLVVVDQLGILRFVNPAAQALTGLPDLDDVLARRVADFVHPDDRELCEGQLQLALVDRMAPGSSEYRLLRDDGLPIVVSAAPLPYDWEGSAAALVMLQDVTLLRQAQDERNGATERLHRILEATAEGIVGLDTEGALTFVNPAAATMLGLDAEQVLGLPAHPLFHHSRADGTPYPQLDCPCLDAARHGRPASVTGEVFWRSDGTSVPVEYRATPLRTDEPSGAVLTFHDISERVQTRERLAGLAGFQRAVLDSLPALTAVVDRTGTIIAVNAAWTRHLLERDGRAETCGVGVDFLAVCDQTIGPAEAEARAVAAGLRSLLSGQATEFQRDIAADPPGGETSFFSLQMTPLDTAEGGVVIGYTDITRRKTLEVDAAHRATHDVLTGLPNRTLLLERLEHALAHRGPRSVAVLFLDLDAFKLVNDGYGHDAGDTVLREFAARLRQHVRPSDTVARLAGDEFVVLSEDLPHPTEAYLLADRLIAAIAEPFHLAGTSITLGVSIGIALAADPRPEAGALLRAADQAMFDAKARGRNRFAVYDATVKSRNHERLEQAMALRRMVERDLLLVHYQPVVDLRDGHLVGSEALLRWRGGHQLPDTATAIALAEEVGLIGRIGRFVLGEATTQAATFRTPDGSVLPLAVNLAPQQLDRSLVGQVERAASSAGFPLASITLELTERSVMSEPGASIDVLRSLRALGVRIALDDFGVGYSSLASLRDLPLDVLKIDAGFVRGLSGPNADDRLIRAVIQLAQALGLEVVAEGIERPDQRDRLLALGCERGQGFLYSNALPAAALRAQAAGSVDLPRPG